MELDDVTAAIEAGDFDDDIVPIIVAVRERVKSKNVKLWWRLRVDGFEVTEQSQSLDECEAVEKETGKKWGTYHPATSAVEGAAILRAHLTVMDGMSAKDAHDRTKKITAEQFLDGVDEYQVTKGDDVGAD